MKSHGKEFIGSIQVKSVSSTPVSGAIGEIVYNTVDSGLYVANGSTFSTVGGSSSLIKTLDPFGDDVLHVFAVPGPYISVQTHGVTPKARVTAYDLIMSIHGGVGTLYYSLGRDDFSYTQPNTDPKAAYIELTCSDLGMISIYIKVTDSSTPSSQESKAQTYVMVQDNHGLCGV